MAEKHCKIVLCFFKAIKMYKVICKSAIEILCGLGRTIFMEALKNVGGEALARYRRLGRFSKKVEFTHSK